MSKSNRSITTKQGDQGLTRLFSGEQISKSSPRPVTYGDLDELISQLSIARLYCRHSQIKDEIVDLQRQLFVVGSEIATNSASLDKLPQRVDQAFLDVLDARRTTWEDMLTLPNGFIIPGGTLAAAHLHVARTIARRCERRVVALHEQCLIDNPVILIWFNRLSDYLYLLALKEENELTLVKE